MTVRYDEVADFYEAGFSDTADPVLMSLLEILGPADGLAVLDVACGHGRLSRELAARGARVTGIDLSQALLAKAKSAGPPSIHYRHADAAAAPELPDATFDAAVSNFGLSDIDNLDGALATIHRTLKPGAPFAFSILHPCFPGGATVSGAWPTNSTYYDERFWLADGPSSGLRRRVGANHRMLSTYLNALTHHGLRLTETAEPAPPAEWLDTDRRDAAAYPAFFIARCVNT